jgi:SNF2 family DNA or RNA helicase
MILLHASLRDDRLVLWGETPAEPVSVTPARSRRKAAPAVPASPVLLPYDAGADGLTCALESEAFAAVPAPRNLKGRFEDAFVWLPTVGHDPCASHPLIAPPVDAASEARLLPWRVTGLPLSANEAVDLLCACVGKTTLGAGVQTGSSLAFWVAAMRFAGALVAREQFVPDAVQTAEGVQAHWKAVYPRGEKDSFTLLARSMPPVCRALSDSATTAPDAPASHLLTVFLDAVCDALIRRAAALPTSESGRRGLSARHSKAVRTSAPLFDSLHDQWQHALRSEDGRMPGDAYERATFVKQVQEWQRPLALTTDAPFRLCFRLEEPVELEEPDEDREEERESPARRNDSATDSPWFVRYLLQPRDDPSLLVPADELLTGKGRLTTLLGKGGGSPREYLLSSLGQAVGLFPAMEASLRTPTPGGCALDTPGAQQFLTQAAWLLEQAGFGVFLPAWWTRKGTKLRLSARARVTAPKMQAQAGLSLDTLVQVDWDVVLGGKALSRQELETLARQKGTLVRLRGQWVQLDAREIEAALDFWKQHDGTQNDGKSQSARDVVRMALGAASAPGGLPVEGVQARGWLGTLLRQMQDSAALQAVPLPERFGTTLRPYQQRGYDWLHFLTGWGLGACLADDMGLGKTPTTLAFLARRWQEGDRRPALVICPTSVVGNWHREAQKFAPDLPVLVHHGLGRRKDAAFAKEASKHAIVLSSFALLHRDLKQLQAVEWAGLVLDEAQNIKNPETRQSHAARALSAGWRIALTGTPVENHVGDLWALFDFLNPGLLGSQAEFRRSFFIPIQSGSDGDARNRLKRLTQPFLLRRLKTDKTIIADLPDKMERTVYCTLTPEQASLYRAVVQEAEEALDGAEGMARRGLVLSTLSRLKQICNHPAHFLGDNSALIGRSGKLARLTEMLEEALACGDKALLFTQFTEMGSLLQKHLQDTFGREVLFLHGSVPKPARDRLVERFQTEGERTPLFLLSLKAGGVGLNLTAASHVFHFDRWWNPAVENQATDRAFRIGQKKNVQVHKFVCAGTLEEKIAALIESKQQMAASVVGSGEGWLTELSTDELKSLFALRSDATEGEA